MTEQDENMIVTMIKLHPLSLSYAFLRASQILGIPKSRVSNCYYKKLRHERQIFCIKTTEVEIWNQKREKRSNC